VSAFFLFGATMHFHFFNASSWTPSNLFARLAAGWAQLRGKANEIAPPEPSVSSALDSVNRDFHAAYGEERSAAQLRHPVFVVLGDDLIVLCRGQRQAFSITAPAFHAIKSIAHAPIAAFALLQRASSERDERLRVLRDRLLDARAELDQPALTAARSDLELVIESCLSLLAWALDGAAQAPAASARFAAQMGPILLRLTARATEIQLRTLHEQTERAFATLPPDQHPFVHVVVAGVHQARARSLAMQYFEKRFGEPPGAERRVTYAEATSTERAALELVGTQRLDRLIARAFFGDAQRLQRDILGDAAAEQLRGLELSR
jgi:hypothetical protein